jgi:hypothetical protein
MSTWAELEAELNLWAESGHVAPLWWRDDDAVSATPALDRLLDLAAGNDVPLALAVIPARAEEGLARRVAGAPAHISVLQHGYAHQNHVAGGGRKCELGAERPAMIVLGELGTGWLALERLFGRRALPILVPPWNRIDPALVPALPEIGFRALSTWGYRARREPVRGFRQANMHVDVIDWRGGGGFIGEAGALGALVAALQRVRAALAAGNDNAAEPVGLLTHHLVMDAEAWHFVASLLARLKSDPRLSILAAENVIDDCAAPLPGRTSQV